LLQTKTRDHYSLAPNLLRTFNASICVYGSRKPNATLTAQRAQGSQAGLLDSGSHLGQLVVKKARGTAYVAYHEYNIYTDRSALPSRRLEAVDLTHLSNARGEEESLAKMQAGSDWSN
jgi:hypothetical protein